VRFVMSKNFSRRSLLSAAAGLMFCKPAAAEEGIVITPLQSNTVNIPTQLAMKGKLATQTEILEGRTEAPMISMGSLAAMQETIALYEEITAAGGWADLPPDIFLKTKAKGRYTLLRERLVRENYLPFDALTVADPDTIDEELISALKVFQLSHGIAPSGKMNERTITEMNIPASARLNALHENLPRIREHLAGLTPRAILVNIPSAQLETVDMGRVHSRHNVVAGKLQRPTPSLKSKVTDVTFNPYWNAPASIVARDLIPKFLKDPTYLEQMQIKVFDGVKGPEIDPLTIDWEVTAPDRYHFQQQPGDKNALATVKVNFKNEHMVYMHDTPHREDFVSNARFQSSGCVRVDNVRSFITWILDSQDGFDEAQFEMITATQETTVTPVRNPPVVRFMYLTAWATEDGRINFRPDIYSLEGTGFILGQPEPTGEPETL
jgi:L,D-transpeptidase YcbB